MSKVEDLTPGHMKCVAMFSCPSIHRLEDGRLLIVGGKPGPGSLNFQDGESGPVKLSVDGATVSIGSSETAIIISPDLLDTLRAEWINEFINDKATTGRELLMTLSQQTKR